MHLIARLLQLLGIHILKPANRLTTPDFWRDPTFEKFCLHSWNFLSNFADSNFLYLGRISHTEVSSTVSCREKGPQITEFHQFFKLYRDFTLCKFSRFVSCFKIMPSRMLEPHTDDFFRKMRHGWWRVHGSLFPISLNRLYLFTRWYQASYKVDPGG